MAANATTPPPDKGAPAGWAPVDGSISIAEDISGSAPKTAAVGDANKSLQTGDRDAALKKLKVAGIEVAVVLEVMPVQTTIEKVHQAGVMIDAGKYYEGSQELRLAQAGLAAGARSAAGRGKSARASSVGVIPSQFGMDLGAQPLRLNTMSR